MVSKGERMRRSIHAFAMLAALALALAGCASSKATGLPAGPTTAPPGSVCSGTVEMVNLTFDPKDCTVPVGTTVTWVNKVGGLPHTVTSEEDKFDSGIGSPIPANGEYEFTFKTPGEYEYYCALHAQKGARSGMIGTINVEAASGTASPTST
jgi:plastocyanin